MCSCSLAVHHHAPQRPSSGRAGHFRIRPAMSWFPLSISFKFDIFPLHIRICTGNLVTHY